MDKLPAQSPVHLAQKQGENPVRTTFDRFVEGAGKQGATEFRANRAKDHVGEIAAYTPPPAPATSMVGRALTAVTDKLDLFADFVAKLFGGAAKTETENKAIREEFAKAVEEHCISLRVDRQVITEADVAAINRMVTEIRGKNTPLTVAEVNDVKKAVQSATKGKKEVDQPAAPAEAAAPQATQDEIKADRNQFVGEVKREITNLVDAGKMTQERANLLLSGDGQNLPVAEKIMGDPNSKEPLKPLTDSAKSSFMSTIRGLGLESIKEVENKRVATEKAAAEAKAKQEALRKDVRNQLNALVERDVNSLSEQEADDLADYLAQNKREDEITAAIKTAGERVATARAQLQKENKDSKRIPPNMLVSDFAFAATQQATLTGMGGDYLK